MIVRSGHVPGQVTRRRSWASGASPDPSQLKDHTQGTLGRRKRLNLRKAEGDGDGTGKGDSDGVPPE